MSYYTQYSKYSLDVISKHPQFINKSLKKHLVDGIQTVGAWGNEPFEIRFKNNSHAKVQVKISIDGTDVLTGKPASTDLESGMWLVNGYGTLSLKAWPETNNGGASFVFTSADNSVALHTHGDLSHRGIIAAAVYEEGHVEPIRFDYFFGGDWSCGSGTIGGSSVGSGYSGTYNSSAGTPKDDFRRSKSLTKGPIETQSLSICDSDSISYNSTDSKSLESLVSVGAGEHVDQKITYVTGLIKPVFAETVRVRYLWWDELVAKLKEQTPKDAHPSGFPGDKEHKIMDLKSTPRIPSQNKRVKRAAPEPVFTRF